MCLSNININVSLFKDVKEVNNSISFSMPFDTIVAKTENDKKYIDNFFVVLNIALLGTNNEVNAKTNVVNTKGKLNVLVRLAKVSKDENKQVFMDLKKIEINLSDENITIYHACVDYLTYRAIIQIPRITLPESGILGDYVIKVLVNLNDVSNEYFVQSFAPLRIE